MGADAKRKTRRGKRGGESKRQTDTGSEAAPGEQHATNGPGESAGAADGYVAPPMEAADSMFYYDTAGQDSAGGEPAEKISPASYGLVNPDLQKYLKSCEGMLDGPEFETTEDRDIFVRNVYAEMKNHELQLTTDHECSRILEKLFKISSEYQIRRFFSITKDDTLRLAIHRFSSHTLQTLLLLSAAALEREVRGEANDFAADAEADGGDSAGTVRTEIPNFEQLVLGVVEALTPHWAFLMSNEYASHILRVLLLVLSGKPIEDQASSKNSIKSKRSTKYMEDRNGAPVGHRSLSAQRAVPESFAAALERLLSAANGAMSDIIARGFTCSAVGSPVLQLMLELDADRGALEAQGSLLDKCLMGLISDGAGNENPRRDAAIKMALEDVVGSHFLQKVAETVSPPLFQTLYDRYFGDNLKKLALHPIANFVVQSMFSNAKDGRQLKAMIAQAEPLVHNLLFCRRPGVVRALLDSCVRLGAGYTEIMNALYRGLGASEAVERKELINLLAFLITYPEFAKADYYQLPFSIQGSLIIQSIVQFPGSGHEPLLESYFGQDPERLVSWCKDASGSRIIEAIVSSTHIPPKSKRKVLEGYVGKFVDLAADKYGSHVVDACWAAAGIEFKEKIVSELVQADARLQDSPFGRTVLRNCGAEQYKRRADEWRQRERNIEKRKRMFKDIVGSGAPAAEGGRKGGRAPAAAGKQPAASKAKAADEIDALFGATQKLAALGGPSKEGDQATMPAKIETAGDKGLEAIADALSGTSRKKAKSKARKAQDDTAETPTAKKSKKDKEAARKDRRAFTR
ncbi:Nucleolar protein 9 [Coemansia biformis]|uniref:Nucleolar protein 9 n=1 Tax=Coemansia biformis TaxID=1286918 RepID=A0A9W8CXA4_9FUNG|nr:Nucleolar protein 9 [Coemansia biformis]